MKRFLPILIATACLAQPRPVRSEYEVRYVGADSIYINGGSDDGLVEGFSLKVKRWKPGEAVLAAPVVAEVVVVALAPSSAVCEIRSKTVDLEIGDRAYLSSQDEDTARMLYASNQTRRYAQVVSFSEGDPLDEEMRERVPRPKLPEVNRLKGRIGFEHGGVYDRTSGVNSNQEGVILRADLTRIAGTYWSFTGYWRGRRNARAGLQQQTISDLLNRTYHIGLYYANPKSRNVAGVGRLFLPWANSLSTIDGAYYARHLTRAFTAGAFGGSTPDPTAWNYNPNRQILGVFANVEGGNYASWRLSTTTGVALTRLNWKAERQFAFLENSVLYKTEFSIYHNAEVDQMVRGRLGSTQSGPSLSRSFVTVRYQPWRPISFDLNHNYFRNAPTFDALLLGTGLLDRLLFQGFSAGTRVELSRRLSAYVNIGRSNKSGDHKASWNQMYGFSYINLFDTGVRTSVRYSRFSSAFSQGTYKTIDFLRELGDNLRIEVQGGFQDFRTPLSLGNRAGFVNSTVDWFLSSHYAITGSASAYRGEIQSYDQINISLSYRF